MTINNTSANLLKKMVFPEYYSNQVSLSTLSKTAVNIYLKDKAFQANSLNKGFIRFRNLSHLNGLGVNEIVGKFTHIKEGSFQPNQSNEYEIQLKYEETLHKQFSR
jgi:hypothetical protein